MIYHFKEGFRFADVDPQKAGERIEKLRAQQNGLLTPERVVEDARPSRSPLHNAFEWNDKAAAHQHRIEQASYLIRSIVVLHDASSPGKPLRAFVNVTKDEQRGYTSLHAAMSDADLRAQVVQQAWAELMGWRDRYRDYAELARIGVAIDREAETRGE